MRRIKDREGLLGVAPGCLGHVGSHSAGTSRRPVAGVADHCRHRAHHDNRVMAEPLETPHRPQRDRVTQVQVRSGRVIPGINPQRTALIGT